MSTSPRATADASGTPPADPPAPRTRRRPSPREDGRDLRASLLAAARAELDEGGRSAVSLRAVARRAGVSHAAPAYAFGDRSGLLTAVAAQGFREMAAVMDEPVPDAASSPLAELGSRYVAFAHRSPALYDLMFHPADLDTADPDLHAARVASLRALAAVTVDPGATPGSPPGELTQISWAFAHGVASLVGQGALPPDAVGALMDRYARHAAPGPPST